MKLYTQILIGMVAGIALGYLLNVVWDRDLLQSLDQNADQRLTSTEWQANPEVLAANDLTEADFDAIDHNHNEVIERAEFKQRFGWQRFSAYTDPIGDLFIRLVKMLVVPMVLVSLVVGAANLGDVSKLGSMGLKAFGFFMFTTAVAAAIGIGVASTFQPGKGMPAEKKAQLEAQYSGAAVEKVAGAGDMQDKSEFEKITDLFVRMVPTNPFEALTDGDMLGVIFFALFLGITITMIPGDKALPLIQTFDALNDVVIKMITLAMKTAPIGVFALMLGVTATLGLDILLLLLKYALVVLFGLILHITLTHSSFIFFYARQSPWLFAKAVKEALLLGFSTSSSSATLPISMNVAEKNLGVSKEVSSFVLPLGATINMDGTALYQAVAALFIAQVYGMDLTVVQQLTIVLTATLASVGAAGVPGAGMITLALVLSTIGVPETGIALIFGLDRIIDMCRTIVNIFGDLTLTLLMAKSEGEDIQIQVDQDVIPG